MELVEFLDGLVVFVGDKIRAYVDWDKAKRIEGVSPGGDPTFSIDKVAEGAVKQFIESFGLPLVYFTEDQGFVPSGSNPRYALIVDPIDGTRPAAAKMGTFCVSAAIAPFDEDLRVKDVVCAALLVFGEGTKIVAEKGNGLVLEREGKIFKPSPSKFVDGDAIFWSMGFVGRPSRLLTEVMGDLIDSNSVKGAFFVVNSATYSATRILLGGFHAWIDIGKRIYEELPEVRSHFEKLNIKPLGLFPYDIASIYLIFQEASLPCTDAFGRSWGNIKLLDVSFENTTSALLACDSSLHASLLQRIEKGIYDLKVRFATETNI